jgi:hypothetical protein
MICVNLTFRLYEVVLWSSYNPKEELKSIYQILSV